MYLNSFTEEFRNTFDVFTKRVSTKYKIPEKELQKLWNSTPNQEHVCCKYVYMKGVKMGQKCNANVRKGGIYCSRHKKFESVVFQYKAPVPIVDRNPKRIIIRKMKDCDTYFHPETGMVFKSKTERKVIGVLVKNDIATLTTDHINLCKKWGFVIST